MVRLVLPLLVATTVFGCRSEGTGKPEDSRASNADLSACVAPTVGKSVSLINGTVTSQFRSVVLLGAIKKQGTTFKRATCTGTFVGTNVILTAAHCMDGSVTGGLVYIPGEKFDSINDFMAGASKGITPKQVLMAGKFGEKLDPNVAEDRRQDMALLIMPDNSAPAVTPIIDHSVADSEPVTLVGYGATSIDHPQDSLALSKRYGYNRLRMTYPGILGGGIFIGGRSIDSGDNVPVIDTMSAPGDSGGPLFVDGAVAGVTTGGFVNPNEISKAVAVYLDLNNDESKKLIQRGLQQGAKIQLASAGPVQSAPFSSQSTGCGIAQLADLGQN